MEQTDADARAHRITHQTNLGNITDRIGPLVSEPFVTMMTERIREIAVQREHRVLHE
jgi:hypothetical protein